MWLFHHHDNAQNETTIHYDGQLFQWTELSYCLVFAGSLISKQSGWQRMSRIFNHFLKNTEAQMNRYAMIYESLAAL